MVITKNSWWRRKLSGKVWVVDKVHNNGPFEIELRLPESNEREAMSAAYLKTHFESEPEDSYICEGCHVEGAKHRADCNYANGN